MRCSAQSRPFQALPVQAVLLDSLGTLVKLEPLAPRLVRELQERYGVTLSHAEAQDAFAAEVAYYRVRHDEGRDDRSLADLRRRCAVVLHDALPPAIRDRISVPALLPAMLASLCFRPYPEVPAAIAHLREANLRLAVVSNWDISLAEVLRQAGLGGLFDLILSSAAIGASKPDPRIFSTAATTLRLEPRQLIHIGDSAELDVLGARAAGIDPILIVRDGSQAPDDSLQATIVADLLSAARLVA
jgi:HAD superfamily hydrolase (TIGR01509 family)